MNRFEQWWAGTEQNLRADIKENMVLLSLLKRIASGIWETFDKAAWGEWKPIETAPKYGPFLVYGGTFRSKLYSGSGNLQAVKVSSRAVGLYFFNVSDFAFYIADTDCHELWVVNPTHWMPLPEAPQECE